MDDTTGVVWLPVTADAVAAARHHVADVLAAWGVDDDCLADTSQLVTDLTGAVIRHTGVRLLGLTVTAAQDGVTVSIREATSSDLRSVDALVRGDAASTAPGARGLRSLDALAACWGVDRTHRCTSVWFRVAPSTPLPLDVTNPRAAAELSAVRARLARTQLLLAVTEGLAAAITEAEVGSAVSAGLRDHLGAEFVGIALVDVDTLPTDRPFMRYLDLTAFPEQTRRRWGRFPLDSDVPVATVARSGRAEFHATPAAAEAQHPGIAHDLRVAETAALAHLPLLADGVCLGTLAVAWRDTRDLDADTRALLTVVAGSTAQALNRRDPYSERLARARRRLMDARAEYDAALDQGASLHTLIGQDLEVTRAATAVETARTGRPPRQSGPR